MAETTVAKGRWTDHWQVKVMAAMLVSVAGLVASGGTWIVGKVVQNESTNAKQDVTIESNEKARRDGNDAILRELHEIKDDVKEIRRNGGK